MTSLPRVPKALLMVAVTAAATACQSRPLDRTQKSGQQINKDRLPALLRAAQTGLPGKAEQYEAFLAAERLALNRDYSRSEVLYHAVYRETPGLVVGLSLARVQMLMGKTADAENVVRKVHLLFPDEPQPKLAEAYLAQLRGSSDEALLLYKQAYEEHKDNEEVAARYVEALLASEKKSLAEAILRDSIRRIPDSPYFLLKLARIKFQEKKYTEAKNLLDGLLRVEPNSIEGWTLAGFIALEEKKDEDAESYFRSAFEKQPDNDTLAKYYVAQLLKLNRYEEAMRLLLRIEQGDSPETPIDPELKFQLAAVLFQLEDFEKAKERFLSLAKTAEEPGRMFYFAGHCDENLKRFEEALELYSQVPRDSSFFVPTLQRRIVSHLEMGQSQQAKALLDEYAAVSKGDVDALKFRASVLARLQDYQGALDLLAGLESKDRADPNIRYLKAVYLEHVKGIQASLAAFEQLVKDHPNFAPALNHLAYTLVERNERLEFATKLLERATTLEPKNGYYLDSLGWAYFKAGHLEKAEAKLLMALEQEPKEPVILEHLGEVKLKQNRFDMAMRYFERAMSIFETTPDWKISSDLEWRASKERVIKRLKELKELALPRLQPKD